MNDSGAPDFNPGWLSRTRLPFLAVLHRLMPSAALRGLGILRDLNSWLTLRVQSLGRSLRPTGTLYEYRSRHRKKQRASHTISPDENELGEQDREEGEPVEHSDRFSPSRSMEETFEQPSRYPVAPELADYPSLAPIHTIDLLEDLSDSRSLSSNAFESRLREALPWSQPAPIQTIDLLHELQNSGANRTMRHEGGDESSASTGENPTSRVKGQSDSIGFPPDLAVGFLPTGRFSATDGGRRILGDIGLRPVTLNRRQYNRLKHAPSEVEGPTLQSQIATSYSDYEASVTATEQEGQPSYSVSRPSRSATTQSLRLNVHQAVSDWLVTKPSEEYGALPAVSFTHRRPPASAPIQVRRSIANETVMADTARREIADHPETNQAIPFTTHESKREASIAARQDWPVLDLIRRDDRATAPEKRLPIQILQSPSALSALQSLPTLGPGEPLTEPVKPVMEKLVKRDLSHVRVYSSPVADAMGAEAFTTGDRIVFAPGRMDLKTNQGLALLGHELAHVGQPLGLKEWHGAFDLSDRNEHAARQQESAILRGFEQQQQPPPRMELRTTPSQARSVNQDADNSITGELVVETNPPVFTNLPEITMPERVTENAAPPNSNFSASSMLGEATAPIKAASSSASAAPDVNALARQVYALLKNELRAERERHEIYRR